MAFILAFVVAFVSYLALTAGSGTEALYWSSAEIAAGLVISVLVGLAASFFFKKFGVKADYNALNPVKWLLFLAYLVPFFLSLTKANLDVAYRVVTGRIKPGIVRIDPGLKSDFGITMLANSITLTPGTLTVEVGKNRELYVHCINVKDKDPECGQVCGPFAKWARRISE